MDETKNQKEYKFTLGYYYNNYLPIYFKSYDYYNTKILLNNEFDYPNLYNLLIYNRVQKKNYAIKSGKGKNQIEIYKNKTIVDETKNK